MDDVDKANEENEKELQNRIDAARSGEIHIEGEDECKRCKEPNDRKQSGYATCSGCGCKQDHSDAAVKAGSTYYGGQV